VAKRIVDGEITVHSGQMNGLLRAIRREIFLVGATEGHSVINGGIFSYA